MQGLSHLRIVNPAELDSPSKARRGSPSADADNHSPRRAVPVPALKTLGSTPTKVKCENGDLPKDLDEKLNALLQALNDGLVEEVVMILTEPNFDKSVLNCSDEVDGYTPLMTAASYEKDLEKAVEMTRLLVDAGADIYAVDKKGNTCLHWACILGSSERILALLKKNINDCGLKNADSNTPLHLASSYGNLTCLDFLLADFITKEAEEEKAKEEEVVEEPEEKPEEDGEDSPPKRNPMRGVRKFKKEEVKKQRKKKFNAVYTLPDEQDVNQVAPHPILVMRNYRGQTAFDTAAEQYSADVKPKEREQAIADMRKHIQARFYRASPFFKTLVLHHADCLGHVPVNEKDKDVWEAPERLQAIVSSLSSVDKEAYVLNSDFDVVDRETLLMAHSKNYVDFVYKLSEEVQSSGPVPFTPRVQESVQALNKDQLKNPDLCDTSFSKGSLQASVRATGAVVKAIDTVMNRHMRNAFCIVRPPGHHAGIDGLLDEASSCGFCIFNNVAIGALHALKAFPEKVKKVAIIDFDVHHGNGTEEIVAKFNKDGKSRIMFFSSHLFDGARVGSKYEFYPGSGKSNDLCGNIINVPMQPLWRRRGLNTRSGARKSTADKFYNDHHGRTEFRRIILERLLPALRAYQPDLILLSAGFDAGRRDVGNGRFMGQYCNGFNLQQQDFAWVTTEIAKVANMCCEGRIVSVLEGGYGRLATPNKTNGNSKLDRSSLARNCCAHLNGLIDIGVDMAPDSSEGEESDTEYDELGRPISEDNDDLNRNSRSRRKPARFEAENDKKGRKRMLKEKLQGKSKKRGRRGSSDDDESDSTRSSRRESKAKAKERKKKVEKARKPKRKQQMETKKVVKPTKAKRRKTQQEEEARQRTQKRQDALEYLQNVKQKFENNPEVYRNFLGVMGDFKQGAVDVSDVIDKVKYMFRGDRALIEGFNTFLPPGYSLKYTEEDALAAAASKTENAASAVKPEVAKPVVKTESTTKPIETKAVVESTPDVKSSPVVESAPVAESTTVVQNPTSNVVTKEEESPMAESQGDTQETATQEATQIISQSEPENTTSTPVVQASPSVVVGSSPVETEKKEETKEETQLESSAQSDIYEL